MSSVHISLVLPLDHIPVGLHNLDKPWKRVLLSNLHPKHVPYRKITTFWVQGIQIDQGPVVVSNRMVTENSTLAQISNSHLFKSLEEAGREKLLQGSKSASFEKGQVVVREGDPGGILYLVKSGTVGVHTTRKGASVHLATLGRGACFGEVALLSNRPRTATVIANEDCTLLCFDKNLIEEVLDAYPKVRKLLETVLLGRAQDTIEKLSRS
ncbi:MAG: cyclic nucleotide-binding domain-containing protein [Pseudomonadota bacterium]